MFSSKPGREKSEALLESTCSKVSSVPSLAAAAKIASISISSEDSARLESFEEESIFVSSFASKSFFCSGRPKRNSSESSASEISVGRATTGKVSSFSVLRCASFPKTSISRANFFN